MAVGGQRHAPAALSPGETRYSLYRRLGGPQGRSGRVRKIPPPPTGIRSPDRPSRSQSLYRLRYPGSPSANQGGTFFFFNKPGEVMRYDCVLGFKICKTCC